MPKTIDNDLPLPENAPTFGFETARRCRRGDRRIADGRRAHHRSLVLVVTMGRKSGSLALAMCRSAGATLAVIPEEFHRRANFDLVAGVDTIVGAIVKRRSMGHDNGVAVVAEGIVERIDPASTAAGPEFSATRTAMCIWPTCRSGWSCATGCARR